MLMSVLIFGDAVPYKCPAIVNTAQTSNSFVPLFFDHTGKIALFALKNAKSFVVYIPSILVFSIIFPLITIIIHQNQ
jgi:hypothetical protein